MQLISQPDDYSSHITARAETLQHRYNEIAHISTETQRTLAQELISRIGTVDWKNEGFPSPEKQRDLSIKFHWGHNHQFDEDLSIKGRMQDRHVELVAQFQQGFSLSDNFFEGKDVLDIGCWTGGTTLMLKTLGARRIYALDEVRKYAETAQILLRDIYGYKDVTCTGQSLYNFENEKFDIVYVPGVVYHLSDPVLGLRRLFNRLNDGGSILVESAGINQEGRMCWFKGNGLHFGGTEGEMSRGGWAWFWPSAECLGAWMEEAGFRNVKVFFSPANNRVFGYGQRTEFTEITRAGLSVTDIE